MTKLNAMKLILIPGAALVLHAHAQAAPPNNVTTSHAATSIVAAELHATQPSIATVTLYSSSLWSDESGEVSGIWAIKENEHHKRSLSFDDTFRSESSNDFVVLLSPRMSDKLRDKDATDGALKIGSLTSSSGHQSYPIPDSADLSRYHTLVIYNAKRSKIVSTSTLSLGTVVAASDQWAKKTKSTTGGYEIVQRDNELFIRFSEDFKTPKPPEPLRILLSPASVDSTTNKNAETNAYFVAVLDSYKGGQEYKINGAGDLNRYRSVLLNCKKYTKLWSAAQVQLRD